MGAIFIAAPADALPVFSTPGWYQVEDTAYGPFVWRGPYGDQGSCEASLPPDNEDSDYSCTYLSTRPDWDE